MLGRIGPYEILSELAQGGMGTVYRARDPQLGREVALKLLRTDTPIDERGLERFRREVLTLGQLKHPNVVRVHTAGAHNGLPFFVQDLVEGESLDQRLQSQGPLLPREAAGVVRKLASALHAAHEAGILHRDVKPANVVMTPEGEPILIDFGVAKNTALALSKTGLTKTGQGVGSPGYWSPEQALGELRQIGPCSDVYSLGATLYAFLVGRAPFEGQGIAGNLMLTINEPPQPPRELRSDVPADLEAICLKCLEKDPDCRYSTAEDLAQDLRRFLSSESVHAVAKTSRAKLALGVLALALLLGGIASAVLTPGEDEPISPPAGGVADTVAPVLSLTSHRDWEIVFSDHAALRGSIDDESSVRVSVGRTYERTRERFELRVPLGVGVNELELSCTDSVGLVGDSLHVRLLRPPTEHQTDQLLGRYKTEGGNYRITEAVVIAAGQSIVLSAGSRLEFSGAASLVCRGQLWCLGTADAPVVLAPSGPVWEGVLVEGPVASAVLSWTVVDRASPDIPRLALNKVHNFRQYGGGLSVLSGAQVTLLDSVVRDCVAGGNGGGLHLEGDEQGKSTAHITRTRFEQCRAKRGGGVYSGRAAVVRMTGGAFVRNVADVGGGMMAREGKAVLEISGVQFRGNTGTVNGGGLFLAVPSAVRRCAFLENSSRSGGGAALRAPEGAENSFTLEDCVFQSNHTKTEFSLLENQWPNGAGLATFGAQAIMSRVRFLDNRSGLGGGLNLTMSNVIIEDCVFLRNGDPQGRGGAIAVSGGTLDMRSGTFKGNLGKFGSDVHLRESRCNKAQLLEAGIPEDRIFVGLPARRDAR